MDYAELEAQKQKDRAIRIRDVNFLRKIRYCQPDVRIAYFEKESKLSTCDYQKQNIRGGLLLSAMKQAGNSWAHRVHNNRARTAN